MPGLPPGALAVIIAAAMTWYVGHAVVHSAKAGAHKVASAVHKITHPHEAKK